MSHIAVLKIVAFAKLIGVGVGFAVGEQIVSSLVRIGNGVIKCPADTDQLLMTQEKINNNNNNIRHRC
jgi:hypothetical protein